MIRKYDKKRVPSKFNNIKLLFTAAYKYDF